MEGHGMQWKGEVSHIEDEISPCSDLFKELSDRKGKGNEKEKINCNIDLPWCSYLYKYCLVLRISPKLVLLCNSIAHLLLTPLVQFTKIPALDFTLLDLVKSSALLLSSCNLNLRL